MAEYADIILDLQIATSEKYPEHSLILQWLRHGLDVVQSNSSVAVPLPIEVTVRIVDNEEIQALNRDFRGKDKPTNVLSFPFEPIGQIDLTLQDTVTTAASEDVFDEVMQGQQANETLATYIGDIVIAAPVVKAEAQKGNKAELAHWAHLTIHGLLHLFGYDHLTDAEAEQMEELEIQILAVLGFANPYIETA